MLVNKLTAIVRVKPQEGKRQALPHSMHRATSVYSLMLVRVMLPPFGNSFSEATIPFSVTFIMSQFDLLTNAGVIV